ncbi:MAG TPA: methyltransferase domain-containing protein [Myxococcota bacterium]|nr:methyltransferase domain-containing protein [Myxococcota bacterium]
MNNSRFKSLFPDIHDSLANAVEQAYPQYWLHRVHSVLHGKWEQLCYEPVWLGQPVHLTQLHRQLSPVGSWSWLLDNTERILPAFHQKLVVTLAGKTMLTRRETFRLITIGLLECDALMMSQGDVDSTPTLNLTPLDQWQSQVQFPRKIIIDDLVNHLRQQAPLAVRASLLHGSLADGRVVDGFSDCDLLLVLRTPQDETGEELDLLAGWILELNHWLLAYNPCMHHGPMMIWESELRSCSPARLPQALLDGGVVVQGDLPIIHYSHDQFSALAVLSIFEWFFESAMTRPDSIVSAFDIIWWTASTSLLPCLLSQVQNQKSLSKRQLFETPPPILPDRFHGLLKSLDSLRTRVGEWVAARLPNPVWPLPCSTMPGACLHYYKQTLRLSWKEAADLGLDQNLMLLGRQLWEYVSFKALEEHCSKIARASCVPQLMAWPMEVIQRPKRVTLKSYDLARNQFLLTASTQKAVLAIYEFGQVGCPGLSDLDFLVVLRAGSQGVPSALLMENLPQSTFGVMGHDPLFIGEESLCDFAALFPIFHATCLWGDCCHLTLTEDFPLDIQAMLMSRKNVIKYPHDLIRLSKELQTRWVTLLSYLNSFNHIALCLQTLNLEVPKGVLECQVLNKQIRQRFSNGSEATLGDLQAAMKLMLLGSVEALGAFDDYWRGRFPILQKVVPTFNKTIFKKWIDQAITSPAPCPISSPPAVGLMATLSSLPPETLLPSSENYRQISDIVENFSSIKARFIQRESKADRTISYYVEPPHFRLEGPPTARGPELARLDQLHSPRFQRFMLALNCFASEHGLRVMINWSKVWEYPWLWYRGLSSVDWPNKQVLDFSSELSPMPWFLASLGARVTLVETDPQWIPVWEKIRQETGLAAEWHIVNDEALPFDDDDFDVVTSFSVIEHQTDKVRAVNEVTRVLKPGGLLAISFDICESEMGMTFPEWNGQALTMREFEELVWANPAFDNRGEKPNWNTGDCAEFIKWHLKSAPHHNYTVGAAMMEKKL